MLDIVIGSLIDVGVAKGIMSAGSFINNKISESLSYIFRKWELEEKHKEDQWHIQQGHVYNLDTGLWKSEKPFKFQEYLKYKIFEEV